jgi:hypothetical protein
MATIQQMKAWGNATPGLSERIVSSALLPLVEVIRSEDPAPSPALYGSAPIQFFAKRQNGVSTVLGQATTDADNQVQVSSISKLGLIVNGLVSNIFDTIKAADEFNGSPKPAGSNPFEAMDDATAEATAKGIIAGLTDAELYGGVELSFHGVICGITPAEMAAAVKFDLWKHPFGRTEF